MYSTCLFCKSDLGSNDALEEFPVGRRVAFDGARGRLWVVCRSCERWNLSPLEERWEAVEACERHFRDTRLRVSTENIGLARLKEGLELVRVGSPLRPEMAAWRYGDQFGRRRKRAMIAAGLGVGAVGTMAIGGAAVGIGIGSFAWAFGSIFERIVHGNPDAVVTSVPGDSGDWIDVRRRDAARMRLAAGGEPREWRLQLALKPRTVVYTGEAAIRVAAGILPIVNRYGGNQQQVRQAVDFLERSGDAEATFRSAAAVAANRPNKSVDKLPYEVRLALEMASHEEAERRALEGELAELERAWRDAEEIAAISDNLLVPSSVNAWIRRLREH